METKSKDNTLDVTRNARENVAMQQSGNGGGNKPKFRDKRTARFAAGERVREFQAFARQAYRRLEILEAAPTRESLMLLPSNRLEALHGERRGQYSIRINDQWRICFEWPDGDPAPSGIEIVDYH
jgi:proteic killer suppression protein